MVNLQKDSFALHPGVLWWNSLSADDRLFWLGRSGTGVPADAWAAYQVIQRYRER